MLLEVRTFLSFGSVKDFLLDVTFVTYTIDSGLRFIGIE